MLKTKSLDILRSLSPKEYVKFAEFAESPFFNKNSNLVKLTVILKKYHPAFDDPRLNNENLYKELFPGKKYNDSILKNLLSEFFSLSVSFLEMLSVSSDKRILLKKRASELNKRGLDKFFLKAIDDLNNEIYNNNFDSNYFKDIVFVNNELTHFLSMRSRQQGAFERIREIASNQMFDFLVAHFKTRTNLILIGEYYKQVTKDNKLRSFNDTINDHQLIELIKINYPNEFVFIAPYYYVMCSIIEPLESKHYFNLKNIIKLNLSKFSDKEKFLLLSSAENVCAKKINSGDIAFTRELFELNIIKLENKIFSYTGSDSFHPSLFRNICKTAVDLGEINWAEKFINDYCRFLPAEDKENTVNYCVIVIGLKNKDYDLVLKTAQKIELNSSFYKLEIRSIMMMVYFEKGYFEEALNLCETFRKFLLNNNELSDFQKQTYINFTLCYFEIVHYKYSGDIKFLKNAENIYGNNSSIGLKDWLAEKIGK